MNKLKYFLITGLIVFVVINVVWVVGEGELMPIKGIILYPFIVLYNYVMYKFLESAKLLYQNIFGGKL